MRRVLRILHSLVLVASLSTFVSAAPMTWKGEISDSVCGISHQKVTAVHKGMTSQKCTLACVQNGGKFIFVSGGKVFKIANQDLAALREHAGDSVQLTGELTGDTIAVAKIMADTGNRKPAANFTLTDPNGAKVTLASYKGKVVVLNFWATWCGPCQVEIPWFVEFNKTYKSRGLAVLGVAMDEDGWKSVKPYLAEKKIDYPIVIGNEDVAKLYGGVDSLPSTFIIDRDGKIAFVHTGLVSKETYEKDIRSLLEP